MSLETREVALTIDIRGAQAIRGSYTHFHRVDKDGEEINGVKIEHSPVFCNAYKSVKLGSEFVAGALAEPPEHMKTMRVPIWKKIPEKKRIAIHVGAYVKAVHPEHRGYKMEIF